MAIQARPTLAIDFDGVIHDAAHPVAGRRMGEPMPGAIEALDSLQEAGYRIVIHTVRGGNPGHIVDWCDYYGVPYDDVTNKKPNAEYYIDDKALPFTSWPAVLGLLGVEE